MKKYANCLILLFFVFACLNARAQDWVWAKSMVGYIGGTHADRIATDPSGNVITAGEVYVAKYNSAGSLLWKKDATNGFNGNALSVCTDASGNILVAGYFTSNITFGSTTLINAGSDDIFLLKYDPSGNVLWAKSAGGSSYDDAYSVTTDASGNIYLAGGFASSGITFGSTLLSSSGSSMFLVKYDPSGSVLWAKAEVAASTCRASSVKTDNSGNVLVTGVFSSAAFTLGTTTLTNTSSPYPDMFVVKYDASGNVLWAQSAGSDYYDGSWDIATDPTGNSYVVGSFTGNSINFGTTSLPNVANGSQDIFIASYDPAGTLRWAKRAGGVGDDAVLSAITDNMGNLYITGSFSSSAITFGSATLTNASSGSWDIFVAKYNTGGTEQWALRAGGTEDDGADAIATDAAANLYITGGFGSTELQLGTTTLTYSGGFERDLFVGKINGTAGIASYRGKAVNATICPNPAGSEMLISAPVIITDVRIIGLSGQTIFHGAYNAKRVQISTAALATGVYQLILNGSEVSSFIKE